MSIFVSMEKKEFSLDITAQTNLGSWAVFGFFVSC